METKGINIISYVFWRKEVVEKKGKNTHFKISLISYVKLDVIVCIKVLFVLYLGENFVIYTFVEGDESKANLP